MANPQNLKPFTGVNDPRRMNGKPKGTLSLSTHIKNMLNDPEFELYIEDRLEGYRKEKGAPIKAIVKTAVIKAVAGDEKAREWLAKYGYGAKLDVTSDGERVGIIGYVLPKPNQIEGGEL